MAETQEKARLRQRFLFPLLASALSVTSVLLAAEVIVRLSVSPAYWSFRTAADDWQADPEIGWVQKPNLRVGSRSSDPNAVDFRTNGDGLLPARTRREKDTGILRIMLIGDSTTVGRAVPESKRLHARLQARLRSMDVRAEVVNAGVQGYSTDQELLYAKRLLPLYRPDIVVLVVCDNDFDANVASVAQGISKPRFEAADGRITGLVAPDAAHLSIPKLEGPLQIVEYSALYRVIRPALASLKSRFGEEGAVVSGDDAHFYRPETLRGKAFDVFDALLGEMARTVQAQGASFWFTEHPHLEEVWDPYIAACEKRLNVRQGQWDRHALDALLKKSASEERLNFCPMVDAFIQNRARGPFHLLPHDPHCNPAGYELEAEVLSECLRRGPNLGTANAAGQSAVK